jgi:NAD(P)-dependent dehydrogenase (short-subunit alcohol dehydrogenase family)
MSEDGTSGALEGRVAIITGAGRGIGREHALAFAREGAKVVVNDLGGESDGTGSDRTAAEEVAAEIRALGGEAVVNGDDVADWAGARRLVTQAIDAFGDLHVLVNNAGILRDRTVINMSEDEWDSVIRVHLKGHFAPTHFAASYWRDEAKAGRQQDRSIVNTSSESGVFANAGQSNYAAAKSGIASMTQVCAKELGRYGARANAILPRARTRLTEDLLGERGQPKPGRFDAWDPANVSPFVATLATADCPLSGEVFLVGGGQVQRVRSWELDPKAS